MMKVFYIEQGSGFLKSNEYIPRLSALFFLGAILLMALASDRALAQTQSANGPLFQQVADIVLNSDGWRKTGDEIKGKNGDFEQHLNFEYSANNKIMVSCGISKLQFAPRSGNQEISNWLTIGNDEGAEGAYVDYFNLLNKNGFSPIKNSATISGISTITVKATHRTKAGDQAFYDRGVFFGVYRLGRYFEYSKQCNSLISMPLDIGEKAFNAWTDTLLFKLKDTGDWVR